MKKSLSLALAFAGAALLGGCQTSSRVDIAQSMPDDYRVRHPIAVREKVQSLTLFIGSNRSELTPSQRAELLAFAQSWRREATGGVVIDLPVGGSNERAAADALREIQSIIVASGVSPQAMVVRNYRPGDRTLGPVRITYPKIAAQAGPCGVWPEDIGPSFNRNYFENQPMHYIGCASQRNLAAQVADPADLVQPRSETPALASRRNTVTEKYRKGEPTATQSPDANKGKISDLGQ